MLSLQIAGKTFPVSKNLTEQHLHFILDSYNSQSLQKMLQGRGQKVTPRKEANLKALAKIFLDEKLLRKSLQTLPEPGRQALSRLAVRGEEGVLAYPALKQQLSARHGPDFANSAIQQLIGSGLALFAFRNGNVLSFEATYSKHSLEAPGALTQPFATPQPGHEQVVWALPQVLQLFKLDPQIEKDLLPPPLKPYNGLAQPKPVESTRFETVLADLFTFTRYVEQNRPKVLQSGDLGKRDFTKLAALLSLKDKQSPQEVRKLDELPHLNFLWQVLLSAELLRVDTKTSQVLAGTQLGRFFQMPRHEQAQMLLKVWAKSGLEEFTRIPSLKFYTNNPDESSIPTLQQQQSGRTRLISLLEGIYRQQRLPEQALSGGWLDFSSLLGVLKESAYEILIRHSYQPESSNYGNYYAYQGDFGRGYYKGFISQLRPPDKTLAGKSYGSATASHALSLDRDWDWVEGEWVALVLSEALSWLGLAELGLDEKSQRPVAFRFTPSGLAALSGKPAAEEEAIQQQLAELAAMAPEMARSLIVQPNFEVLVLNPVQNLPLLRRLEEFATQLSLGDVAQYRITKESVLQGLRGGMSVAEILSLLRDNSRVPVSQNIETSLQDWAAAFERLVMQADTTVIEVGDPARLDKLLATEPGLVLRRLGDNFAQVTAATADKVARRLLTMETGSTRTGATATIPVINTAQLVKGTLSFTDAFTLEVKNATPYQLFRLGQFAELESWEIEGRHAIFKLTAAAAERARSLGLTFAAISRTCESWLPAPATVVNAPNSKSRFAVPPPPPRATQRPPVSLPAETRLALKGWLGEYGDGEQTQLGQEAVIALQVPHSELLDDILAVPELNGALVGRIGPGLALVRLDQFEEFRQHLEKFGLAFGKEIKLSSLSPRGILTESLPATGGLGNTMLAVLEQSLGGGGNRRGTRDLSNVDIATLAAIMENNQNFNEDINDDDDGDDDDEIIFLLEEILNLLLKQTQAGKIKSDPLATITGNRFAEELLGRVEEQGYQAKKKNDLYWEDKHEDAHYYEELSPRERRETLLESCFTVMPSPLKPQRQAAVMLLPLFGNSIARQMTEYLYHPDAAVRYNTCLILGEIGDRESLTHLQPVLDDDTATSQGPVSSAAIKAVGEIQARL